MGKKERWKQVEDHFHKLVELSDGEREAYLDEVCQDDEALRSEVLALLAGDEAPANIFNIEHEILATTVFPETSNLPSVDPYQIIKEIGKGGMGTVYLAERTDGQYSKLVALKLVKRGMDSDEIVSRFRRERQILAGLEHSNIARLYDGGISSDGRPFLVMEYVDGKNVIAFCDDRKLDIDDRLALFLSICNAVQFAHQNLIVHRDIKPGNILVTELGEAKLLDFGIAKILRDDEDGSRTMTRIGVAPMTPQYASPEQINGGAINTSTDVYSLGCVLFELLTGQSLANVSAARPTTADISSTKSRHLRPSTIFHISKPESSRDSDTQLKHIAEARSSTVDKLRRRLTGDIDTIIRTALQEEPSRRYPSAAALAEDISLHLRDLPIKARPDSRLYRARKFAQRHTLGIIGAAAAFSMLCVFITLLVIQQGRTAHERDVAQSERDRAAEVSSVLESFFDASDPYAPERLDTLRVGSFLKKRSSDVQKILANKASVGTATLNVLGRVYYRMGMYDDAQAVLESALGVDVDPVEFNDDNSETRLILAAVYKEQARLSEADSLNTLVLATRTQLLGLQHENTAEVLLQQGILMRDIGNHQEADSLLVLARAIFENTVGEHDQRTLSATNELATLAFDTGDYVTAEKLFREVADVRADILGESHPLVAVSLNDYASALRSQGRYDESENPVRQSLTINRKAFGNIHPTISSGLNTLAAVYRRRSELDEAQSLITEALGIDEQVLGFEHPGLAYSLTNLGEVLREKKDYNGAEAAHRRALFLVQESARENGIDDVGVGIIAGFVGRVLWEKQDYSGAEDIYRFALPILVRTFPADHQRVSGMSARLGSAMMRQGIYDEAEKLLEEGYHGLLDKLGANDDRTAFARAELVSLYEATGRSSGQIH